MIVHFIFPGETLESIAEEIRLENPQYIKEYHNERCPREDLIQEDLIPGKKLLLPDNNRVNEYNSRNDAPFKSPENNPVLHFNPENLTVEYRINIQEKQQDEEGETLFHPVSYTAILQWVKTGQEKHIFHFIRKDFGGNESKMTQLAKECVIAINPLIIITNLKGEILNISLEEENIKNFPKIKERLNDQFPDQYAGQYIEELEYVINNPELFDRRMKEDLYIKFYCAPLRNKFENGKSFFKTHIADGAMQIEVVQKVENTNSTEEITLMQTGKSLENEVDYKGNYQFSIFDGIIKKAEIQYVISLNGVKTTTEIHFDCVSN